jgi:hypothetical protein
MEINMKDMMPHMFSAGTATGPFSKEILPILFAPDSVNQILPSGPAVNDID